MTLSNMESSGRLCNIFASSFHVAEESAIEFIKRVSADKSREERNFYHLSVDEVVRRVKEWRCKLPRVEPHYAVKCNDTTAVLATLALLGTGFDCASRSEIDKVLALGVSPSRIIYAHPCKIARHISHARACGVKLMTFDSKEELNKVARLYPGSELLLRIRCDAEFAQAQLGMKFGAEMYETRPLLAHAAALSLNVVGVAFHVGSGCCQPSIFVKAINLAKQVFIEGHAEGFEMSLLDIGGGFLGGLDDCLDDAAHYINAALDECFPEGCGVRVIAEPGRFMVASAFTLATPIINRRVGAQSTMYFIDDGVYGSFNCVLYDHQTVSPRFIKEFDENLCESSIWGPTCDGFDQVLSSVKLPSGLCVGDWFVWPEMGAYTLSAAGSFNGFAVPEVLVHLRSNTRDYLESLAEPVIISEPSSGICSEEESSAANSRAVSPYTRKNKRKTRRTFEEQLRCAAFVANIVADEPCDRLGAATLAN